MTITTTSRNEVNGFTLIDLLLALAIGGITLGLTVPSFTHIFDSYRSRVSINTLVGANHFARVTAISKGKTTTLCAKSDEATCGTNWSKGILIFIDDNRNGRLDEQDTLLRTVEAFKDANVTWKSFGSNNYIRYSASGSTINQNGSFTYCPANGDEIYANQVIINRAGRTRTAVDYDKDGIKENSLGENLSCS
ncbi:hypothetical protein NBRC116494_08130 [Aurantivibrio plasticivorans]